MKWPHYPKLKPSGVEWVEEVPEHWKVLPLKRRHRVVNGGTPSSSEDTFWNGSINWITPEDLGRNDAKRMGSSRRSLSRAGLSNCGAQLVPRNSIVISTRAPIGHVALIDQPSCTNHGCRALVLDTAQVCSDFYYYSLIASRPLLQASGKGTTFLELSAGLLGLHPVAVPPPDEQYAIADFLDRETGKIDTLVAKNRTLIERLKEKRNALISRTVIRGLPPDAARAASLDPHPKLKPSGVEWLGSATVSEDDMNVDGEGNPYAKVDDLNYVGSSLLLQRTRTFVTGITARHRRILLFPKRGAAIFTNKVVIADGPYLFDSNLMGWRITRNADLKFVAYCLTARRLDDLVDVSTVPQINNKHIYPAQFPRPPLPEQRAIADFLDRETAKIDTLVAKVEITIERLQEYRTALITAAVTGKIDVRRAAA